MAKRGRVLIGLALFAGLLAWGLTRWPPKRREAVPTLSHGLGCAKCTVAAPRAIPDPLMPGNTLVVSGGATRLGIPSTSSAWVTGPTPETQPVSADKDACAPKLPIKPPRFRPAPPAGLYYLGGEPNAGGEIDLVMHFHGHDLAMVMFAQTKLPFAWFAVRQRSGGFRTQLGGPVAFQNLIGAFEQILSKRYRRNIHARRVALTAWSGGYEAIGVMLEQSEDMRADAIILLDGLHTARRPNVASAQLEPFLRFAKRAARGETLMIATHSSIIPPNYASSTEAVHRLLASIGRRPVATEREDAEGLDLLHAFSQGNLHARGYSGGKKPDHCAHLALYPMALNALARFWKVKPHN